MVFQIVVQVLIVVEVYTQNYNKTTPSCGDGDGGGGTIYYRNMLFRGDIIFYVLGIILNFKVMYFHPKAN